MAAELDDKFYLPTQIVDNGELKQNIERRFREFDRKITALKFAAQKERILAKKLVVLEEIKRSKKKV